MWSQTYDGPANTDDVATDLVLDHGGNVVVTGGMQLVPGGSDYRTNTVKYAPSGTLLWDVLAGHSGNPPEYRRVDVDGAGNV